MSSITITNRRILASQRAIQHLDTLDEKHKPLYRFQGGAIFRLALANRLRRLTDMAKDINDGQVACARQLGYFGDGADNRDDGAKFNIAVSEMLDAEETFEMATLNLSALDLETNAIPMWVLAELDWLFPGDGK